MSPEMYRRGQIDALQKFAATDVHDLVTSLSALTPAAGAMASGMTAPEGKGIGYATRTGLGAVGGRAVGEMGGVGVGEILAALLNKNPALYREVGGSLGRLVGGATGGHVGHHWAERAAFN